MAAAGRGLRPRERIDRCASPSPSGLPPPNGRSRRGFCGAETGAWAGGNFHGGKRNEPALEPVQAEKHGILRLDAAEPQPKATNPIGHKNAQKSSWAPVQDSRAPIGATYGTALDFDSSCFSWPMISANFADGRGLGSAIRAHPRHPRTNPFSVRWY